MVPVFNGSVEQGKLKINNPSKLADYLRTIEGNVQIIIEKPKKRRSENEHRYYWGVIVKLISDHTGHSKDEIHEALKHKFLWDGLVARSTTRLSVSEAEEFYAQVRMWAASELELMIPLPNEIIL